MKRFSFSFLIVFACLIWLSTGYTIYAKIDPAVFSTMKARLIGPANMSGRIADIDAVRDNSNIIYVATSTGGLWKSINGGITWEPIFDNQNCSSIGAVAIFQPNPNIVWIGTGEPLPRNSSGVGRGVFKSLDGGKTWQHMGLEKTEKISAVRLDPVNPDVAYVAALGTTWGENPERGVFKTTDGGKTWQKILYVNEKTGAADLAMAPDNPNKLVAAMWEHRRWPWFFTSGGPGSGLYISGNGGQDWKKLSAENGLPKGDLGRIGISFATNKTNIVYALVEAKRSVLLRSEDGGWNWRTVNSEKDISGRPFYYSRIWVNPQNENIIYLPQSDFRYSEDAGKTLSQLTSHDQAHADHHAMWLHPNGEDIIAGNDGGVVISSDRGKTWRFVENIPLAQFYHISYDMETPYNVYGGLQDNGSWRGPAYSLAERELRDYHWLNVGGGDGFDTEPDPENSKCCYGMSQGGRLYYFDITTGISETIVPTESDVKHRFHWNAGFAIDPFEPATIYLGSQFVHRSKDKGQSWEIISPDLTTNDPAKQKQSESGGLSLDVTNAENHTTILCISPSPVKQGVIWVSTDDGCVQLTRDGGKSWEKVSVNINKGKKKGHMVPDFTWAPHIEASHFDAAEAFVVFDNHRRADWTPYVYVTRDSGKTWESLATPGIDGFIHVIRQDTVKRDLLFIGTEFGMFVSLDGGKEWMKWTHGLPTVPVRDMAIHPRENDLIIGTHGRAAYIIDDITPLRNFSEDIAKKKLHLFPLKDTIDYKTGRLSSVSTSADAAFQAQNKPMGAVIDYFLTPSPKKEKQETGEDTAEEGGQDMEHMARMQAMMSRFGGRGGFPMGRGKSALKITILDSAGKEVRTLDGTEDKGINRVYWDLRHEAPQSSGGGEERWSRFRRGMNILPGTYTVKVKYEDQEMSGTFTVKPDPRLNIDEKVLALNYAFAQEVQKVSTTLTKADEKIKEIQGLLKTIREYADGKGEPGMHRRPPMDEKEAVKNLPKPGAGPDPGKMKLLKACNELDKKLTALAEKLSPDTSKIQGISDREEGLTRQVRMVMFASAGSYKPLSQAVTVKYEKVKVEVDNFLKEFNEFFSKDMEEFKKVYEESGFSLFKPYKPLAIDGEEEKK